MQLRRLRRASYQLAFRDGTPVLDIAVDNGYAAPESFARAFRSEAGQWPSEFRRQPDWSSAHALQSTTSLLAPARMPDADDVAIVHLADTAVAAAEHRGDPRRLGDAIRRLIAYRKQHRLSPAVSATFNIVYDDEDAVAPEDFRFDVCAATDRPVTDNAFGVVGKTIAGGRYARLRHVGSDDTLRQTVSYLYAQWLPQSGETPADAPLLLQRLCFFPDVPEGEAVTEVLLPLAG